ncbi:fasciclin domain-containing protein [Pseudonocardia eucalypti]|uniref:Fasciclin domain-containing protein n=1 Tax=Pseudonocardia eucalypti TaxID=648755 RepID=A0ABP9PLJ5_9PSEU|nr:putative surface protein with fasciclin (FAS1) repeats [Pseudonocardia eucalypti]
MPYIQRLLAAAAATALALGVSACGSEHPTPGPIAAVAASDGVTTASDTFGPACGQLPQGNAPGSLNAMGPQPVASAASTNPLLKTLVGAVKAAGLVETLNQQRAITVFAPYDPAFAQVKSAMGEQRFNALLKDKQALGGILQYHVVGQRYDRDGLAQAGQVSPLPGGELKVANTGAGMTVTDAAGNTANVLCGNIPTANATVFVIDKVLMPARS